MKKVFRALCLILAFAALICGDLSAQQTDIIPENGTHIDTSSWPNLYNADGIVVWPTDTPRTARVWYADSVNIRAGYPDLDIFPSRTIDNRRSEVWLPNFGNGEPIVSIELRNFKSECCDFVERAIATYPPTQYIFQSDTAGNVNWMLVCPDGRLYRAGAEHNPDIRCSVYQRLPMGNTIEYEGLAFRPGQEVHLKAQPNQTVKVASFNDFSAGTTGYPIVLFDQPYYNVFYLGYWTYLPESALKE